MGFTTRKLTPRSLYFLTCEMGPVATPKGCREGYQEGLGVDYQALDQEKGLCFRPRCMQVITKKLLGGKVTAILK